LEIEFIGVLKSGIVKSTEHFIRSFEISG